MTTRFSCLLLPIALALCVAASAQGTVRFGVTEDAGKYADDGGATFFPTLTDLGMTQNRITVFWDAAHPAEIQEKAFLDRSLPVAAADHVGIVFSVQPLHPTDVTSTPGGALAFASYAADLARTYPQVKQFVIGNEPNQPRFWRPQFSASGRPAAAAAYEQVLALSYDALKAVDPTIDVIGVGLSPRGNDDPHARSNVSTSPVRFIHDLGVAYRASGRTRPIMDELAFHPYPNPSSGNDPLLKGYQWPNAGVPNFARVKQAVWDAFAGTAQPTFVEAGGWSSAAAGAAAPATPPLTLFLDETGWQARIPPSERSAYTGRENSKTVSEAAQARIYGGLVRFVECDPSVTALDLFHLVDESALDRFQSGLVRADGTHRPSYDAVKSAIAETGGVCSGLQAWWRHSTTVAGPAARFGAEHGRGRFGFGVSAKEAASFSAGIFRAGGRGLTESDRGAIAAALASSGPAPGLVVRSSGVVRAYWPSRVTFGARALPSGWYVYGVRLVASMNPSRTALLVGTPFRVG